MNASVTGSALNQIPLVNSTQLLTASAQQPMTSVLGSTPIVASGVAGTVPVTTGTVPVTTGTVPVVTGTVPVVTGTVPVASTVPATSVLGASSVQPLVASGVQPLTTPLASGVATTPLVASGIQPLTTPLAIVSSVQPLPATSVAGTIPLVQQQPVVTSTLPVQSAGHFGTTYSNPVPDDDYRLGRGILDDFRPTSYKTLISTTTPLATTTTSGLVTTTTPSLVVTNPGAIGASNIKDFL